MAHTCLVRRASGGSAASAGATVGPISAHLQPSIASLRELLCRGRTQISANRAEREDEAVDCWKGRPTNGEVQVRGILQLAAWHALVLFSTNSPPWPQEMPVSPRCNLQAQQSVALPLEFH